MTPRAVLGVTASLKGRPWTGRLDIAGEARALAIAQLTGTSDVLSRVLAGRGINPAEAASYLDPSLRDLMPDPSVLADMERAAARIAQAMERARDRRDFRRLRRRRRSLRRAFGGLPFRLRRAPLIHIPDRIFEGYGPNVDAIQSLAARGAKLLVTVDCGTTSHGPLQEAARLGLEPIVLDHHQAPEHLPEAIIVNPNRLTISPASVNSARLAWFS